MNAVPARGARSAFLNPVAIVVALAFLVRALYVWMGTVEYPIRGDINQYVLYAWNLTHRATFSTALPDADTAVPDSYRNPGYPLLLAGAMRVAGHSDLPLRPGPGGHLVLGYKTDLWMRIVLGAQIVLGTLTVWLVIALGRRWLPDSAAIAAGCTVALWPHLVTFTGVLLSETLFAFMLVLSLQLLCSAAVAGSSRKAAVAGIAWGFTYLVNPVVALFPLLVTPALARSRRLALTFLVAFLLLPAAWSVRTAVYAAAPGSLQRIEINFVQGSWPQYLTAFNSRFDNPVSRRIVDAVDAETAAMERSMATGLRDWADRMALDPPFFLKWYLLQKPYLLWDWHIRIGAGDIYFLPTGHSAFERIPLLSGARAAYRWSNPVIFALAAAASLVLVLARILGRRQVGFVPFALGLLLLYLTAVHTVLQAEPRYAVAYRPEEVLMAVTALLWTIMRLRNVRERYRRSAAARTGNRPGAANLERMPQASGDGEPAPRARLWRTRFLPGLRSRAASAITGRLLHVDGFPEPAGEGVPFQPHSRDKALAFASRTPHLRASLAG